MERTMHGNACTCYVQTKSIMGKNLIQIIALTKINQAHNPRMHKMTENAMYEHVITKQQNPTQKFYKKTQTPPPPQKSQNKKTLV